MRTGAKCVMDGLKDAGVDTIFGLPGGTVLDLFAEMVRSPFHFVLVRHEQGAAHMADGYARASGRTGVCLVTSGPGATNTVTGLATANMDGVPMVCVTGQVPSHMIGNDAFQEADIVGITRAVTKHNYLVRNVDDIPRIFAEAFKIARTGRPGPVLIDIPKDVQRAQTAATFSGEPEIRSYRPMERGHSKQITRLAQAINKAKKPVFLVGGGVISGDAAAELTALARKAQVPVATTLLGLGSFPETDPLSLRMVGMHGVVAANRAVSHCDLLVSVGARFDDRVTGKIAEFAPHAVIGHIDIDPSAISKSVATDIPVVGHVKQVLAALIQEVEPAERTDWLAELSGWKAQAPVDYDRNSSQLLPQFVIDKLYEVTKGGAIVVTDVGQHQMWSAHHYKYTQPRTFISSGGLGTMGFGLPAAIGAQMACPDKRVVAICGDGGVQMNFQELVVAVEHKLPVTVLILNNGHLGMVRQWQEMFYRREYSASVLNPRGRPINERLADEAVKYRPDFVMLAEAHGAQGIRVTRKDEVTRALEKAFSSSGPTVVECVVAPEENVYPMVPPGASLNEMIQSMA
ncbi:MAG: biosynthetic-type acetolactate synthase large subunit [Kiritimatiellia bacterium]